MKNASLAFTLAVFGVMTLGLGAFLLGPPYIFMLIGGALIFAAREIAK